MPIMKRATLLLEDALYDRAKKLCRQRHQTLKDVINDLIRRGINSVASTEKAEKAEKAVLPIHKKNGPRPDVDISDRDRLYDLMDNSK